MLPINAAGQFRTTDRDALVIEQLLLTDGRSLEVNTDRRCNFFAAWKYATNGKNWNVRGDVGLKP